MTKFILRKQIFLSRKKRKKTLNQFALKYIENDCFVKNVSIYFAFEYT